MLGVGYTWGDVNSLQGEVVVYEQTVSGPAKLHAYIKLCVVVILQSNGLKQ